MTAIKTPAQRIAIRAAIGARLNNSIPTDDEAMERFAYTLGLNVPAILDGADPEPADALWIVDRHGNPRMVCTPAQEDRDVIEAARGILSDGWPHDDEQAEAVRRLADEPTGKRRHSADPGRPWVMPLDADLIEQAYQQSRPAAAKAADARRTVQPVGLGWAPGDYREPEQEGEG